MAYEIIIEENRAEVHSDLCDKLIEEKTGFDFQKEVVHFQLLEEVKEFAKNHNIELTECEECKAITNYKEFDEDYDDFYEEFDDEDDDDEICGCNVF